MQTSFTAEQLRDPATAASNQVLRSCVHCGLCTATCPTFLLLGDELDSPRGRIYLIKDMLETGRPATEEVVRHIDRCLSCLACMTTCPSGVHYMHLIDHARSYIEATYRRPWHDRALRAALGIVLPRPALFRAALLAARLVRPAARLLPGNGRLARRMRAMLALVPDRITPSGAMRPQVHRATGERRARVALLAGCAQQVLSPEINAATIRLLTRLGVEVVVARGAACCGALTHHMGQHAAAMASARANIAAWSREIEGDGLDAIVINASGCGTTVKDYGFMFRAEPEPWRGRAAKVASLARDISEFVAGIGYAPTREAPGLTVAYHSACSLQHGQQITAEPKTLLRRAGFTVVEPAEAHICCGSAGTYNMLQPEIAARLRARKLANLHATGADLVAAGNVGCITQLAGQGVPVVHTVELLDWMAGGPVPRSGFHPEPRPEAPPLDSAKGTALGTRPLRDGFQRLCLWWGIQGGKAPLAGFRAEPCAPRRAKPWQALLFALLCAAVPALAQTPSPPGNDRRAALDRLLGALKSAPSEEIAGPLEHQIRQLWLNGGTPAVTLLMSRGLREMKADARQDAIEDFSAAITLDPAMAEAYHQRGIARYLAGDTAGAIADIQATLQREPRSFAAFETLAMISEARKDWKGAYEAWQKLLEIDPKTPGGQERLKDLRRHALGEEA